MTRILFLDLVGDSSSPQYPTSCRPEVNVHFLMISRPKSVSHFWATRVHTASRSNGPARAKAVESKSSDGFDHQFIDRTHQTWFWKGFLVASRYTCIGKEGLDENTEGQVFKVVVVVVVDIQSLALRQEGNK